MPIMIGGQRTVTRKSRKPPVKSFDKLAIHVTNFSSATQQLNSDLELRSDVGKVSFVLR